jgi:hypothetical protein
LLRGVGSAAGFAVERLGRSIDPRWEADRERFVNSARRKTSSVGSSRGCLNILLANAYDQASE